MSFSLPPNQWMEATGDCCSDGPWTPIGPPPVPPPTPPVVQQKTLSLYYEAVAGQLAFPLGAADLFGNSYLISAATALSVTRNGGRLSPVDPTGDGGYSIALNSNSINLAWPAGDGEIVIVDIFWEAAPVVSILGQTIGQDVLGVTAPNTLTPLSRTPDGRVFVLYVEGRPFFATVPNPAFAYSGTAITWTSTVYSLMPGNEVVALYTS